MVLAVVIGGAGRMGAWFASFLKKKGYQTAICDKNERAARKLALSHGYRFIDNSLLAIQSAEVVVLATPTDVTANLLKRVGPHLSRRNLLVEISSIKEPIRVILRTMKRKGVPILSIHPMFGPGIKSLAGKAILTISVPRGNVNARRLLSAFRKEGARVIRTDFEEHEKIASVTLALPHFMNITLVCTLKSLGLSPKKLRALAGTSFNLQLLLAEAIYKESPTNEASILTENRRSLDTLRAYMKQNSRTMAALASGDKVSLIRNLKMGRDFLERDTRFADAYDRFNAAIEAANLG
jgi:prephenate dehydrogenase